eukprot:3444404-Pleurochrysis_carterae.AAC.1
MHVSLLPQGALIAASMLRRLRTQRGALTRWHRVLQRKMREVGHFWDERRSDHFVWALRCAYHHSAFRKQWLEANGWPPMWDSGATLLCTHAQQELGGHLGLALVDVGACYGGRCWPWRADAAHKKWVIDSSGCKQWLLLLALLASCMRRSETAQTLSRAGCVALFSRKRGTRAPIFRSRSVEIHQHERCAGTWPQAIVDNSSPYMFEAKSNESMGGAHSRRGIVTLNHGHRQRVNGSYERAY